VRPRGRRFGTAPSGEHTSVPPFEPHSRRRHRQHAGLGVDTARGVQDASAGGVGGRVITRLTVPETAVFVVAGLRSSSSTALATVPERRTVPRQVDLRAADRAEVGLAEAARVATGEVVLLRGIRGRARDDEPADTDVRRRARITVSVEICSAPAERPTPIGPCGVKSRESSQGPATGGAAAFDGLIY